LSADRSFPPVSLLGKSEFQTLFCRIFIEFTLWLFLVSNINLLAQQKHHILCFVFIID
jgi:hypothetical protein